MGIDVFWHVQIFGDKPADDQHFFFRDLSDVLESVRISWADVGEKPIMHSNPARDHLFWTINDHTVMWATKVTSDSIRTKPEHF